MKPHTEVADTPEQDRILQLAMNCRHYAMCKIDFLGTGVCPSGRSRQYVAFYPQGRMSLYAALAQKLIPVTAATVEAAETCTLCGRCDYQCYFVTEMRPGPVMKGLKELVARQLASGDPVEQEAEDPLVEEIRTIVGREWAANDRGITVAYSEDPCALAKRVMPRCVAMPATKDEVAALLALLAERQVRWVVRANGTNVLGFHLGDGVIIDLNRMKEMVFDERNWSVRIGPGVAAFDLQREAVKRGYRVNVAEPAALVCGSLTCSGILSLFSTAYGTSADNYINAEFVTADGRTFSLNDVEAPNLFAYSRSGRETPGICVALEAKLHPKAADEEGVLVPFQSLEEALAFAGNCASRRIGLAIGILGMEYVSAFMSPTRKLAADLRYVLEKKLGIAYLVLVLGDGHAMRSIAEMGYPLINQRLFTALSLGLPSLKTAGWLDLVAESFGDTPFSYLQIRNFAELVETALTPSPAHLAGELDPELRTFFEQLYARPEMTDLVWQNMFRITSTRIGRDKHFLPLLMYVPTDSAVIAVLIKGFEAIAERHRLKHSFGFITPVDAGKRSIFEYDFYNDHTDQNEAERMREAVAEAGALIEKLAAETGTIRWLKYILHQGYCRKENLLYA